MVKALIVADAGATPVVTEVTLPAVIEGLVRVRLGAAGVCHSDLSLVNGTLTPAFPVIPGHEAAGEVVELGEGVSDLAVGTHVVINWAPPCRVCWSCTHGEPWLCSEVEGAISPDAGVLADGRPVHSGFSVGAFAEEVVLPARALVPIPDWVPFDIAALLGCAVLTGVGAAVNTARIGPEDSVLVVGLGGVGLSAVLGAALSGAHSIIAVDVSPEKEDLARAAGATDFLVSGDGLTKRIRALTGGRGVDHALECVGSAATIRAAWSAVRRGGQCTIVGVGGRDQAVTFSALELFHFARTISSSIYGESDPERDIPLLLEHVEAGRLDLGVLVSKHIGLDGIGDAFDRMRGGVGARSIITFADDAHG